MWGRSVDFHEMFFRPLPIIFMKQPNGNRKILILIRTWKVLRRYRSTDMCFQYVIHSQYCRAESISCVEWRRPYSLCMVYNCGVVIIKLRRVASAVCGNVWRTYSRYMAFLFSLAFVFFFFFFFVGLCSSLCRSSSSTGDFHWAMLVARDNATTAITTTAQKS